MIQFQNKDDGIEGMPRELRIARQRCGNFEEIERQSWEANVGKERVRCKRHCGKPPFPAKQSFYMRRAALAYAMDKSIAKITPSNGCKSCKSLPHVCAWHCSKPTETAKALPAQASLAWEKQGLRPHTVMSSIETCLRNNHASKRLQFSQTFSVE